MSKPSHFGLIGDVHQEHERLESLLRWFGQRRVDLILCVGDISDGEGDLRRTIGLLEEHAVQSVVGNHDRWLLQGTMRDLPNALPVASLHEEDRSYLAALPKTRSYETPNGRLLLCHGMGDDDMGVLFPDDDGYGLDSNQQVLAVIAKGYRFVVAGHTHRTMVRRLAQTWFINPGTLRPNHGPLPALLDGEKGEVTLVSLQGSGVEVVARIELRGNSPWVDPSRR